MKVELTINYVKYFRFYHLALTCIIIICFNVYTADIAECEPLEFKPYIQDANFIPLKEVRRDGLLQGIQASGYVEKPQTNYVAPMLDNIKPSTIIEYKENSIITSIKAWFSFESWYKWYNQDSINVQKVNRDWISSIVGEPILSSGTVLAPITSNMHMQIDQLVLTPEALENVINLINIPSRRVLLLENTITQILIPEQSLINVNIPLHDNPNTIHLINKPNKPMVLTKFDLLIKLNVPTIQRDYSETLHAISKHDQPIPMMQKAQMMYQESIETKIQLSGEPLINVMISEHDNLTREHLTCERNEPMVPTKLDTALELDITIVGTISQLDVHIIPDNVPVVLKDIYTNIRQSYLRYQPDMMQLVHVDYKTEAEIIDELEMNYTIRKRQLIDPIVSSKVVKKVSTKK